MKKNLLLVMLVASLLGGCGTKNEVDTQFNIPVGTQDNAIKDTEENNMVTATSLMSKLVTDLKTGIESDIQINEVVAIDVDSTTGKTYNTLLNIKEKGSMCIDKDNNATVNGYLTHYYTYNTNYADVYTFLTNKKAADSKALINKSAKEYTQNLTLYNTKENVIYNIDNTVGSFDLRKYQTLSLVISDFSNLKFTEKDNGYEVTGTISDKLFGNLFNLEDIYMGSNVDTKDCSYNVTLDFDKEQNLTNMTLSLAKGSGIYDTDFDRVRSMYMSSYDVTLSNVKFGVEPLQIDTKENVSKTKFIKMVNKH